MELTDDKEKEIKPEENDIKESGNDMKTEESVGYSKKSFWNERFEKSEQNFDWYADWEQLKSQFVKFLKPDDQILMVGCGNSKMSNQMYKDNFKNIINIDISDVVIDKMQKQFPLMKWLEMDATKMTFEDNTFDCVIDKGTLDAIMCCGNPRPPTRMIREMHRVTKIGGKYCIITHGAPDTRVGYFNRFIEDDYKFDLQYETINLSFMANFINSIRNNTEDHSIKSGLEDKNKLMANVMDAFVNSYKDMDLEGLDEKTKKKVQLCLRIQKVIQKYQGKNIKANKKLQNIPLTDFINQKANEEPKEDKNSFRKNHCYLYIFTKRL